MRSTVEITLYPNAEDFIPPIQGFIDRVNAHAEFDIKTVPTATIICGEHHALLKMIATETEYYRTEIGMGCFVMKLLPGYEAL